MSKTLQQIFTTNPITSNLSTDLMYFVQSPYTPGTDAGMTYGNFSAQFVTATTIINPAHGGTGINNGSNTLTLGGNTAFSGAFTFTGTVTGNTSVIFPTSGTLATTSQIPTGTALTKTDDTNVTLTLGGSPAIALVNAASLTLGWTGILSGTRGGTGVNNGASLITVGGNFTMSGAFAFTGTITNTTTVTFPTSGTLATTSQLLTSPLTTKGDIWVWSTTNDRLPVATGDGKILQVSSGAATGLAYSTPTYPSASATSRKIIVSDGTNWVASTETYAVPGTSGNVMTSDGTNWLSSAPAITTVLTTKGDILGFSTVDARIPVGTTNGQVLQVNSANAVGVGYSTPTYPSASGTAGTILRSDGTNNLYTTTTYPNTNAINTIMYASSANVLGVIAAANNGVMVSSATGVPSMLAGPGTTGNMFISNAAAAPSFTTFTYPTTIGASGSIYISNGTNIVSSTSLWPNTVGTSGKFLISDGTTNGYSTSTIPTSAGATANKVLLSDGTNYVLSTPTFPNASATTRKIIVSDGTNWIASTETYAVPGTSGNVMTSNGTNWTSAAPAASGTVTSVATAGLATGGTITTTGTITVTAAVQSDQETATSTSVAVVPGVQQFHPSAAKAWIQFQSITTTTVQSSYNVTSLTDNGTGLQTLNFTTAFSSANYCAVFGVEENQGTSAYWHMVDFDTAPTASALRTITLTAGSILADVRYATVACFGDQ